MRTYLCTYTAIRFVHLFRRDMSTSIAYSTDINTNSSYIRTRTESCIITVMSNKISARSFQILKFFEQPADFGSQCSLSLWVRQKPGCQMPPNARPPNARTKTQYTAPVTHLIMNVDP